jgi:hypothetical protein
VQNLHAKPCTDAAKHLAGERPSPRPPPTV